MTAPPPKTAIVEGRFVASPAAASELRSRRRQLLSLAGGLLVVYVLALLIPGLFRTEEPHRRSSMAKRADGYFGVTEVLSELGYDVVRYRETYGRLPAVDVGVLVMIDPVPAHTLNEMYNGHMDQGQVRLLSEWVNQGGHLVATLPSRNLLRVFGVALEDELHDPPSLDASEDPLAAVVDGIPATHWAPATGTVSGARELRGIDDRWTVELASVLTAAGHLNGDERAELRVFDSDFPDDYHAIAWLDEEPLILTKQVGVGRVWLCSTPLPFSNLGIGGIGTAALVVDLLHEASAEGRRRLLIDEFCHGLTVTKGPWWWIWNSSLFYPVAGLMVLLVLASWRGSSRLGAPYASAETPRRAKEEFTISIADIARRARRHRGAARGILEGYRFRNRAPGTRITSDMTAALTDLERQLDSKSSFGQNELAAFAASADKICREGAEANPSERMTR